ncbi:type II toxin-antitoxin system antitoxin DNA ADP-ribosyl glycohydrolase DarG [Luteococcus sp. Sow4_B9]|uniref:type II toxin-antitoxin system antitoxin DNA ADP-ribosyl glycohydrolase DarG n=1 Tax=Luteococcus sp. Sow4_B9 TaxID=3438792 RepID=UPI003F9B08A2
MTFSYGSGNLLTQPADALVNTVNTQGVMGKGIALQFKKAWPEMYRAYAAACKRGEVQPGMMHVWPTNVMTGPRFIINFPTKRHWRAPSRMEDVEAGLDDLARVIQREGITSIAIPPLGCGNGGLQWSEVEPRIRAALAGVSQHTDILLFAPNGAPAAHEQPVGGDAPKLTPARAALLALMRTYQELTLEPPKLIEIQKLAYFLQNAGERLRLKFAPHLYGPYADDLRKTLRDMEGHYIVGFGDGSSPVIAAESIRVRPETLPRLDNVLEESPATKSHLRATMAAVEGFESLYGLELLSSVHWVMAHDDAAARDPGKALRDIREWSNRKANLFTPEHVETAWRAVHDRQLLGAN